MQDQGQNVLKAECKVSLPAVLVPREAQGARPSENARALLLHGVLKGASIHRYLTFALLRDAPSPVVRHRLTDLCVCAPLEAFTHLREQCSPRTPLHFQHEICQEGNAKPLMTVVQEIERRIRSVSSPCRLDDVMF